MNDKKITVEYLRERLKEYIEDVVYGETHYGDRVTVNENWESISFCNGRDSRIIFEHREGLLSIVKDFWNAKYIDPPENLYYGKIPTESQFEMLLELTGFIEILKKGMSAKKLVEQRLKQEAVDSYPNWSGTNENNNPI